MPSDHEDPREKALAELRERLAASGDGARPGAGSFSVDDLRRSIRKRLKASKQVTQNPTPDVPKAEPEPEPEPPETAKPTPAPIVMGRLPGRRKPAAKPAAPPPPKTVRVEEAAPGRELVCEAGTAWLVETWIDELDDAAAQVGDRLLGALNNRDSGLRAHLAEHESGRVPPPEELLFMDIETTGLSSTPLFLIGVLSWERERLICRQYLARHYGEEAAVVAQYADDWRRHPALVTYNGRSFDAPYIRARAAANGVACPSETFHLDLLLIARRLWRESLPNCRLQTVEAAICGRLREGDIPGAEIPDAYHDFVRTGDASKIASILHHNLLDLVTLADLMGRLPKPG